LPGASEGRKRPDSNTKAYKTSGEMGTESYSTEQGYSARFLSERRGNTPHRLLIDFFGDKHHNYLLISLYAVIFSPLKLTLICAL